jgi:hypothetical protein
LWAYVARTWVAAHVPSNCGMVLIEHGSSGYAKPVVIDDTDCAQDAGG